MNREMAAIMFAVKQFRPHVLGRNFNIAKDLRWQFETAKMAAQSRRLRLHDSVPVWQNCIARSLVTQHSRNRDENKILACKEGSPIGRQHMLEKRRQSLPR
jgi:hypothetical protein